MEIVNNYKRVTIQKNGFISLPAIHNNFSVAEEQN